MSLNDKIDFMDSVKNLLIEDYGLSNDDAIQAMISADFIPIYKWESDHECARTVRDYAEEAYEFWKAWKVEED